jgi:hypothetical protein
MKARNPTVIAIAAAESIKDVDASGLKAGD